MDADWTAWSTFTSGAFIGYLAAARNVAQTVDSTVIRGANDTVFATSSLNVYPSAGSGSSTRAVSAGTTGTVIDGPIVSVIGSKTYYFVWWKIHWNDGGVDGWSVEDYMSSNVQPPASSVFDVTLDGAHEFWTDYPAIVLYVGDGVVFDAAGTVLWDPTTPEPNVGPDGASLSPGSETEGQAAGILLGNRGKRSGRPQIA